MSREFLAQIGTFSPSALIDSIGVYDQNFNQVFRHARPIKVTVKPELKTMDHPLESGSPFTDHVVYQPIEVEVSLMLRTTTDFTNTYAQMTQFFNNATMLNVKTKASVYPSMIITSLPHDEAPEYFDTLVIALKLRQVIIVNSDSTIAPANPNKKPTVKKGTIESSPANAAQRDKASLAYRIFH